MNDKRIEAIEDKLSEIMTELVGNPKFDRIGIAGHVKKIQETQELQGKEIAKIKSKLFKEKVIVGAAATMVGAAGAWSGKAVLTKIGTLLAFWK